MKKFVRTLVQNPPLAAYVGALCAMPLVVLNLIARGRIEPVYSALGLGSAEGGGPGLFIPVVAMLLLPAGALIGGLPMIRQLNGGVRKIYPVNALVCVALLGVFGLLTLALGRG